jgi:hypothetical protein
MLGELAAVLRAAYGTDPRELERIVRGLVDRGFLFP